MSNTPPSKTAQSASVYVLVGGLVAFIVIATVLLSIAARNKNAQAPNQFVNKDVIFSTPHSYSQPVAGNKKVALGEVMPDFELEDLNGVAAPGSGTVAPWKLSNWRDHYALLFFADLACPCVQAYNDRMKALHDKYAPDGLRIAYVFSQPGEKDQDIRELAANANYRWPCVRDRDQKLFATLNAKCTTEVFLLDKEGKLRYHGHVDESTFEAGAVKHPDLENAIQALIANKPVPVQETSAYACTIDKLKPATSPKGASARK